MDPFPRDLKSLFLEKNTIFTRFTIEDQDMVKYDNFMIENTQWLALYNLVCQAKVIMDSFLGDLKSLFLEKDAIFTRFIIKD